VPVCELPLLRLHAPGKLDALRQGCSAFLDAVSAALSECVVAFLDRDPEPSRNVSRQCPAVLNVTSDEMQPFETDRRILAATMQLLGKLAALEP
jgi:hypothetical protein